MSGTIINESLPATLTVDSSSYATDTSTYDSNGNLLNDGTAVAKPSEPRP